MSLAMNDPRWVNATCTAVAHCAEPRRADCVVCRVVPGGGMGVQFLRPDPEAQAHLVLILQSWPRK